MAARAVLGNGLGHAGERDAVDRDVLVMRAAAFPYLRQPGRLEQGEALLKHAGRGPELTEIFPVRRLVAGLLFELAAGAGNSVLPFGLVADQARGQFKAELA